MGNNNLKCRLLFLSIILIFILSIGAVCAVQDNTTAGSSDGNGLAIENTNFDTNDRLGDAISNDGNANVLKEGETVDSGNFYELNNLINKTPENGILNLEKNYTFDSSSDNDYKNGIAVTQGITINGNGFTVSGNDASKIFNISGSNVIIKNLNFIDGSSGEYGGAVYWNGNNGLLDNCTFEGNSITGTVGGQSNGGAIYVNAANVKIINSVFANNSVYRYSAGAIYMMKGSNSILIENCTFKNNTAMSGGALDIGADVVVNNCTFIKNKAIQTGDQSGGAIWISKLSSGSILINSSKFIRNNAAGSGGAIGGTYDTTIVNSYFENNSAAKSAGAVMVGLNNKLWTIENSTFINNTAKNGGAVFIDGNGQKTSIIKQSEFVNNTALELGGAIYYNSNANRNSISDNVSFINNFAKQGGAIYYSYSSLNTISNNVEFINNTAYYETTSSAPY